MLRKRIAGLVVIVVVNVCCLVTAARAADQDIALPKPRASLNVDVMKAFQLRRSDRNLSNKELQLEDIATIAWAGYGINRQDGKRTVPSANGKDALDLYVLLNKGIYYYEPEGHRLKFISGENIKRKIARQAFVTDAPLVVVLVGKPDVFATASPEGKAAYVSFTAGCASQNIYLAADALHLGTVVMGSINKDVLARSLALKDGQVPLYIMPVGYTK
jgi:SagB-type dehydrogenase family enzyme